MLAMGALAQLPEENAGKRGRIDFVVCHARAASIWEETGTHVPNWMDRNRPKNAGEKSMYWNHLPPAFAKSPQAKNVTSASNWLGETRLTRKMRAWLGLAWPNNRKMQANGVNLNLLLQWKH